MFISVIICTYARTEALKILLDCLFAQTYRDFEVVIVDGSEGTASVSKVVESFQTSHKEGGISLSFIRSPKGLTRQRNAGLRHAKGDIVCFFDDDVTFGNRFLEDTANLLERSDLRDVGGITAYDTLNYPATINMRWRVRLALGVVSNLEPGSIDRLGRAVPLSFLQPFAGVKRVGHFSGFCMIYRRSVISGLWFDEQLPTYGGEDRDFSFQVGQRARLVICGDLHLQHHHALESRQPDVKRSYQDGFGTGRTFAKQVTRSDWRLLFRVVVGDILVSILAFVRKPSWKRLLFIFARPLGILAGYRSYEANQLQDPRSPEFGIQ